MYTKRLSRILNWKELKYLVDQQKRKKEVLNNASLKRAAVTLILRWFPGMMLHLLPT
jgi:hypothetical protein